MDSFRAAPLWTRKTPRDLRRGPNFKCPSCNLPFLIEIAAFVTHKVDNNGKLLRSGCWILAIIVFGLVIAIRIRLLGIPLERDEGEYAYAGQLILQGIPPYKLAYNMKFPGTYAAYAVIMSIFGQTITGIHLGLLLVNAATIVLIFFLGRRLVNSTLGLGAAMSYAVLSVSPSVLGLASHATNFVMLPVLGGTLMILKLSEPERHVSRRLFTSGLLFGVGLLMKQPALFFILFGATYLLQKDLRRRLTLKRILLRNLIFWIAAISPLGITCLILWHAGVLDKFWFWTVSYASQYGSFLIGEISSGRWPLSRAAQVSVHSITEAIGAGWMLWALAGLGLVVGLLDRKSRARTGFLFGLLAFSALAVCQDLYFRPHYFIMILPAVSLLVGVAMSKLSDLLTGRMTVVRFIPLFLLGAALSLPMLGDKQIFFGVSPVDACRLIYPENPFAESVKIADYLRQHTSPDDTIAVLGSEPQIYFYSHRHSATGYIYTYGLMEPQKYAQQMQQEMIREIEGTSPKYLVSVVIFYSWLWRPESDRSIFTWANEYTAQNYTVAGFVNIVAPGKTDYYFDNVPQSVPQLGKYILIYERKS
jgi:Dolichyl-phosphate-mannose-protein mannosyltransferase